MAFPSMEGVPLTPSIFGQAGAAFPATIKAMRESNFEGIAQSEFLTVVLEVAETQRRW
jgi:hypothetical protein